jgi:hypothetical protein
MSVRMLAPVCAGLLFLANPVSATEVATQLRPVEVAPPVSSSWTSYLTPIVIGGALGAVALPYAYPMVAPTVGNALVTTGGAIQTAAPAVGVAVLDTAALAGTYAAGATSSASGYVAAQTVTAQALIGAGVGAFIGWFIAPR